MPCKVFSFIAPDGSQVSAHIRFSKPRPHKCSQCSKMNAMYQCDFVLASGKTCDAWLCASCLVPIAPDVYHCPTHPRPLFGGDAA